MERIKVSVVVILGILFASVASAQTPQMNEKQQNRINSTLESKYPGLDRNSVRWENDDDGYFIGSFLYDKSDIVIRFDRKGNWMESSERVNMIDLPGGVRNYLESSYGEKVSSVDKVTNKDDEVHYNVTVIGQDQPVRYNEDGTLYKDQPKKRKDKSRKK